LPNQRTRLSCRRMPSQPARSPDLTSAVRLLPCLGCHSAVAAKAIEEVVAGYVSWLRGGRRPPEDKRRLPHLPRTCCRQTKPDVAAMVG